MESKVCSKCGIEYPLMDGFFHKDKSTKSGYKSYCKQCNNIAAKIWRQNNHERYNENIRRWRQNNPQKTKEYHRVYRKNNKEKYRKICEKYRSNNLERVRARDRERYKNNPYNHIANQHKRRALKLGNGGFYTTNQIQALYDFQEGRCFHCDCDISEYYEIDHWIPLSRGGSNWPENLRLLCKHCNSSKKDRLPWQWHKKYAHENPDLGD